MKKPLLHLTSFVFGALAVCALAAPAHAQEPPPAAPPPSAPPPSSGNPTFSGGAIGIGALQWLTGGGTDAEFVYDQTMFHVEVGLGYDHTSQNNTSSSDFRFGVGGWYHLARGSMADFSIGGAVRLFYNSPAGMGGSFTDFGLEPGAEARMFFSPNFAFSGRVGVGIVFGDNGQPTTLSISGQTIGAIGFTYFFR